MTTTEATITHMNKIRKYTHTSKHEHDTFVDEFTDILTLHKDKLGEPALDNKLNPIIERKAKAEARAEAKADAIDAADVPALTQARVAEYLADALKVGFSLLMQCIADESLKETLRAKHKDDIHGALNYLRASWNVTDNDTRITILRDRRRDFMDEGMTKLNLAGTKEFADAMAKFNRELKGTPYHLTDSTLCTDLLDTVAVHDRDLVKNFKAAQRNAGGDALKDFDKMRKALEVEIEENDRVDAKLAARTEREALRTQVVELQAKLAAVEKDRAAYRTDRQRQDSPGPCPDCGYWTRHRGACIGKEVAEGRLTIEQAVAKLPQNVAEDRRRAMAERSKKRYLDFQAAKTPGQTPQSKVAPGQPPPRSTPLVAMTRIVVAGRAGLSARDTSGGAEPLSILRVDSQCEQHMLNDARFFPFGVTDSPDVKVRVADAHLVDTGGTGFAVFTVRSTGAMIVLQNSLLVPGLDANLMSTGQAWKGARVRAELDPGCCLHFPCGSTVPMGEGYTLDIVPATTQEAESVRERLLAIETDPSACAMLDPSARAALTESLVTRGKSPGGQVAKLGQQDTQELWSSRLNISAERLRALPDITTDAPEALAHSRPSIGWSDDALAANAPRLHPAPVERPRTDHPGQRTCTDLAGPFAPSKFGGHRYATNHIDVHTGEFCPDFLRTKSEYPIRLESYLTSNEGRDGCTFVGGTLYTDNEIVLNSVKVYDVTRRFGVTINNSCEYEPWQNGIPERGWRSLMSGMRVSHERGGAGEEYWPFSMTFESQVSDRTGHAWGGDDERSPFERRTGRLPSLAIIRTLFCLAYVRRPPALREGKVARQADRALHLGMARTKPGYVFEMLEGPRKGKLVYSTQAVFRERVFPLREMAALSQAGDVTDEEWVALDALVPADDDDDDDDDTMPELSSESDESDDESEDDDDGAAIAAAPPRRSARLAPGAHALPQTVFAASRVQTVYLSRTEIGGRARAAYTTCVDSTLLDTPDPPSRTRVPRSFLDIASLPAEERPRWYAAHYHENDRLFAMQDGKGLTAVPRMPGDTILPLRTVYTLKTNGQEKARTVLGGDRMVEGRDYQETFSPTVTYDTLRTFVATCQARGDVLMRGDDTQAYLQADRQEARPNRAAMPPGYVRVIDGVEHIVEVGNLYGDPAAGRHWYTTKVSWLCKGYGFVQSKWDPCLFTYTRPSDGQKLYLIMYVDDFLTSHQPGCDIRDEFAAAYSDRFQWTDYGTDLGEFLSIRITQTPGQITLDHERYITELAAEFVPTRHTEYETPSTPDLRRLVTEATAAKVQAPTELTRRFHRLVMCEVYLASTTAPDVAWAAGMLARAMQWPTPELMKAAERVLIYLYGRRHLRLRYTGQETQAHGSWAPAAGPTTDGFYGDSDADFDTSRSTSAYIFFWANAAIAWCMRKQASIALSSFESEIYAGSLAACEAVFLRGILSDLGFPQSGPSLLRMDNSAAIDVAKDPVLHAKSKHIMRRELHIRELVSRAIIQVKHVKTKDNTADALSKHLDRPTFQRHRATTFNM